MSSSLSFSLIDLVVPEQSTLPVSSSIVYQLRKKVPPPPFFDKGEGEMEEGEKDRQAGR
jgi:hypothetical protein